MNIAVVLIILAYLSDFLDGFLARKLKQETRLGLILDPLADKIWTIVMMVLLVMYRDLPIWIAVVVIFRDVAILLINTWLLKRKDLILPSDEFGKKYMVLIGLMIIGLALNITHTIWLVVGIGILAPITLYRYARRVIRIVQELPTKSPESVKSKSVPLKK